MCYFFSDWFIQAPGYADELAAKLGAAAAGADRGDAGETSSLSYDSNFKDHSQKTVMRNKLNLISYKKPCGATPFEFHTPPVEDLETFPSGGV